MCPPALRGDFNFRSPKGEGNCELAGPERDESPGGAFEATFPTEGRDAGATPPPVNLWPLSFDQESGIWGLAPRPGQGLYIILPMAQLKIAF